MQKSEEALLAANKTLSLDQRVVDLRPTTTNSNANKKQQQQRSWTNGNKRGNKDFDRDETPSPLPLPLSSSMDYETAKELDDSVMRLTGNRDRLIADLKILTLNPLYTDLMAVGGMTTPSKATTPETTTTTTDAKKTRQTSPPPAEHYLDDRIDRDRRYLAVSIAASTEEVAQWRLFCQEQGGIFPILETVREGARAVRSGGGTRNNAASSSSTRSSETTFLDHMEEESFHAACSACRAIRDLCAISPEQAAVVTDNVLRANAAWDGGLMADFTAILHYACAFTTAAAEAAMSAGGGRGKSMRLRFRNRRDTRLRCQLYVTQLLLAMVVASDDAVHAIRTTKGLSDAVLSCSSYARTEQTRRWLRYPGEMAKWLWRRSTAEDKSKAESLRRPFLEANNLANDLKGQVQRSANQILAAIGYNQWVPKIPGQKGLRILCLDGGGSRGMAAITAVKCLMDAAGDGADVADSFDIIVGTSTGGIIAFLIGLQRESSAQAVERYKQLINKIFIKSALSTPMMLFTTASYDESHFMSILVNILKENSMLDSRADPAVPLVCCLTSKMSSTPTRVALFRNYNYAGGEQADPFTIDPKVARQDLNLPLELEHELIRRGHYHKKANSASAIPGVKVAGGSRHPGSFRVLQRYALRASTAAPTVFKPVMMGGEMYCDGGIVASNPAAVAIHEARAIFPDIPIELVVSVGTGAFLERKSAPRVGWDGIIGQIVNSATDGEQIHHVLEDILGQSAVLGGKKSASGHTRYFRFNPIVGSPDDFPIDVTDPAKITELKKITMNYMSQPEQQSKMESISDILRGRKGRLRRITQLFSRRKNAIVHNQDVSKISKSV